jgi:membrane-bound lytic murein transglycosylase D
MITMKNVNTLTKLRRLTKSVSVIIVFFVLAFAGSAFTAAPANEEGGAKRTTKDSTQTDKYGFKSLFGEENTFNPSKPYLTELNPLAVSYVQGYVRSHGALMERIKIWGKPYLDLYDGILSQHGLPKELKYLSVIESNLKAGAVSIAGAVGPWQIMDFEARRVGLTVNAHNDERVNYTKSTHAAARILKELYGQFNDWLLVIAAYNCGQGRLRQAIRKSGSRNFWALQNFLPLETRNHVKKFIGTHFIFEGNGGLTTMTAAEVESLRSSIANQANQKPEVNDADEVSNKSLELNGRYNSAVIAKNLTMDILQFNKLNPGFDKVVSSGDNYKMKLPVDKMKIFDEKKQQILNESLMFLLSNSAVKVSTP